MIRLIIIFDHSDNQSEYDIYIYIHVYIYNYIYVYMWVFLYCASTNSIGSLNSSNTKCLQLVCVEMDFARSNAVAFSSFQFFLMFPLTLNEWFHLHVDVIFFHCTFTGPSRTRAYD